MIHHCPECKSRLEISKVLESISQCECGYELRNSPVEDALEAEVLVSQWLSGNDSKPLGLLKAEMTLSERYGFLLCIKITMGVIDDLSFESFIEYCGAWPTSLWQDLDALKEKAELVRVKSWKKVLSMKPLALCLKIAVTYSSRQLSHNIVLTQVLAYYTLLMVIVPSSAKGNIGDVSLSPLEASTLLFCTTDEVYRLYEFGEIKAAIRPRIHTKIASHESAFTLRSVIETKLTRMSSESDALRVGLPER